MSDLSLLFLAGFVWFCYKQPPLEYRRNGAWK